MSSYLPIPGSNIAYYGKRFVSPSLGFALSWMYWYTFSIIVPAEVTAASLVVEYWNPPVHSAVWITIFLVVIIGLNCFPVKYYGETEFWFASLKVFGIIGLLIMALVLVLGGGPHHDRLGFRYWTEPGPIAEYLVGGASGHICAFVGVVCFSIFAFAFAPELLVVTGGEMVSPRQNLPKAGKRYFYRLIFFYVLGSLAIGLIVSQKDPLLLGGGKGAAASPWAIAAKNAGISGLPSIINAVILTSAWSSGNSYLFLSSRTLYSMALSGNAPRIFAKCTKSGIPYYATAASASISLLAYLNVSNAGVTVFNWFVNLINTGGFTSWVCICVIYVRFRKATFAQNLTTEDTRGNGFYLPYRSRLQPVMSYISGSLFLFFMLLSGFANFVGGNWNTSNFLTAYIGIPIFFLLFAVHKCTKGKNDPWVRAPQDVDLVSGLEEVVANERPLPTLSGQGRIWDKLKAAWE